MKKSVVEAIGLADKAIENGKKAVAASQLAARKDPKNRALAVVVNKNKQTLARAKDMRARLASAEKVANAFCPLQAFFVSFTYVQAE